MNKFLKLATTLGAVGSIGLLAVTPTLAAPFGRDDDYWMNHRNHDWQHHSYPRQNGWSGYAPGSSYGYGYDPGFGLASGFIGGVFGTILGSALVHGNAGGHVWRCEHTYRSYVASSNTYTGFDGARHACVL